MADAVQADTILGNLVRAVHMLEECPEFALLVPEVRVNLAYALAGASNRDDVAAIEGRITVVSGRPRAPGLPGWGASDHMARLLIEVARYEPSIRAGINFRYDHALREIVEQYCTEKGCLFGWIDRVKEPREVTLTDGSSMPWKIKYLYTTFGGVPRLFFESEGWGKEPLFVAIGADAVEVAGTAIEIAKRYASRLKTGSRQ